MFRHLPAGDQHQMPPRCIGPTRNGNDCYSLRTGKWPIDIVDLPKDGDFPVRYLSLPEGSIVPLLCHVDTFF